MAKPRKRYSCQACGSVSSRWQGQCSDCSEWNTLVEDEGAVVTPFSARHNLRSGGRAVELVGLDADVVLPDRVSAGSGDDTVRAVGGGRDVIDCGPGRDRVEKDRADRARNCEVLL